MCYGCAWYVSYVQYVLRASAVGCSLFVESAECLVLIQYVVYVGYVLVFLVCMLRLCVRVRHGAHL